MAAAAAGTPLWRLWLCAGAVAQSWTLAAGEEAAAEEVLHLNQETFKQHIKDNKYALVQFSAPWCGHCKKLTPEYEKAAVRLKDTGIKLIKIDATADKDLAATYSVKGFPTMLWFEGDKHSDFDGGRQADTIVEWVLSMSGPAVLHTPPPGPVGMKPQLVLSGEAILSSFEEAAKEKRRQASWYFKKGEGEPKVALSHKEEEPIELTGSDCASKEKVLDFLAENMYPLFGVLDADTFDKYVEAKKHLVWGLFPLEGQELAAVEAKYRPMMTAVAKNFKGYHFTFTDTEKFKEAIDSMLSVSTFPALVVQSKAGDKKKWVYEGKEMSVEAITQFIWDLDAGKVEMKLKSEPEPATNDGPVKQIVGSTLVQEVFTADRDILLEVYAPWCGHCKKLEPEYTKLARKVQKEGLADLLGVAKIDGTVNDSPSDSMDWSGFPTIYLVKAGDPEPMIYDGDRTAKALWKYVKKHATKADEIRDRLDKNKGSQRRAEEL